MSEGLQSHAHEAAEQAEDPLPTISVCRSCPEKAVFLEAGNTDGWIATDSVVEPSR